MASAPGLKLNNGVEIPTTGLGCWSGTTKEQQAAGFPWMLSAIQQGYKHFDTAASYGTEPTLARAIKESGVKREDLFITTKLAFHQTADVHASFERSLKDLDTDYVDLYLMHWPQSVAPGPDGEELMTPEGDNILLDMPMFPETWAEMEKIYESGRAKAIGVSNFSVKTLGELLKTAKITPAVNQIELHPYLAQPELKAYCDSKGIKLIAYTPTGYSTVRSDSTIVSLAEKYKVNPAQVILAWHRKRGVIVVPKSSSAEHQRENLELPTLSDEDFAAVGALDRNQRLCNKANERGLVGGWTYEQLGW